VKLGLTVSVALLCCACAKAPAVKVASRPAVVSADANSGKLTIIVDSEHCYESKSQPEDSALVSLVCLAEHGGVAGVVLTLADWSVLRDSSCGALGCPMPNERK
jgi:hypothetical protein